MEFDIIIKKLIILILVFVISINIISQQADAFIEFKKYKVINSPKVCGDKMCSEIDEQRSKKGLSTRDIKVCGDRPCYDITSKKEIPQNKSSPIRQYRLGVTLDQIKCNQGQSLVIKAKNQLPSCISLENIEKIRERGWAISEQKQQEMFQVISDNKIKNITSSKDLENFNSTLNITPDEINNQRYLMFDGFGWHGLHNVEITIRGESFEESIRTKTDDRGHLNMPWPIPNSVGGKIYHIFASDGIHQLELDIPIAPKR